MENAWRTNQKSSLTARHDSGKDLSPFIREGCTCEEPKNGGTSSCSDTWRRDVEGGDTVEVYSRQ